MENRPQLPRLFRQPAPDQIEIREGGGCISVFGLPFLAAGIFMALIGIQVLPVSNSRELPGWAWPLVFLMGLAFAAVGGGLVFGRRWTTLDSGEGVVVNKWGLLVALRKDRFPLSDYDGVRLGFEEGDSDTADRYPVTLQGKDGRPNLALSSPADYATAREQAQYIAHFLHLSLVDASTEHEVVLAPARTGADFADLIRSSPEPDQDAARPPFMLSQVEQSGRTVKIVIPGPGFKFSMLLGIILPAAVLWYAIPYLLEFFSDTHTPEYVQFFFVGFLILFFGILPAVGTINGIIRSIRGRTTINATVQGITIEEQSAWRKRITSIPAGEILGLDYSAADTAFRSIKRSATERYYRGHRAANRTSTPSAAPEWLKKFAKSKGVLVKSKRGIVTFAAGLPDDEVRYLYALLKEALVESEW